MKLKENISDYTESEFIDFLRVIFSENESDTDETLIHCLSILRRSLNTQMEQILSIILKRKVMEHLRVF